MVDALLSPREALIEQCEEALIRLAYLDMDAEETEALIDAVERDAAGISVERLDDMYRRSLEGAGEKLDRAGRAARHRRRAGFSLPRKAQVALVALVILSLGAMTAIAAVPAIRAQVLKFLIRIETEYTELSMIPDESAAFDVPEGWQGEYFMSYVPEGFEVGGMDNLGTMNDIFYTNPDGDVLYFTECGHDVEANLDTEDAQIEPLLIQGNEGYVAVNGRSVKVFWAIADRYFIVEWDGDAQAAIEIAQSVKKII